MLRELGCDQIQGFYVSRAVPPEEVALLLGPGPQGTLQRRMSVA
jgi:EAL domain-containing protein (putative c-di-GMP-specific phosphodiesterase class I)